MWANMEGKFERSILITLLLLQGFSLLCTAKDYDFFYLVQQWPGAYCDTKQSCCYPTTGKPKSDFGLHGLWPNYVNGSYPSDCDPRNPFDSSQVSDLIPKMQQEWGSLSCPSSNGIKFWTHEWNKHGTCSQDKLDQHAYFSNALQLKQRANLLQSLKDAGINPDGKFYTLNSIISAIKNGTGNHTPFVQCNTDPSKNKQLYQVYVCVDKSGEKLIDCPILPKNGGCSATIEFPKF